MRPPRRLGLGVHCLLVLLSNSHRRCRGRRHDRRRDGRIERVLRQEWFKVGDNFRLVDSKIVVQQIEQLLFHQVDFRLGEHLSVSTPVLVLGTRIVEVLRGDDQCGEEDSVSGAGHTLGDFGQSVSESLEVDKSSEEGGDLDVGLFAYNRDESLERGESRSLGRAGGVSKGGGRRGWGKRDGRATRDDRCGSIGKVV